MTIPTVSIIVPCYKSEKYIRQCVESILAQTYKDWEAIFVVDGVTPGDDTLAYLNSINDRRFLILFRNGKTNPATARNDGWRHARGEYVCFLDADDWWDATKLHWCLSAFNRHPELMWVSHWQRMFVQFNYVLDKARPGQSMSIGGTGQCMFRESLLERAKEKRGYLFDERMDRNDDADLILAIRNEPSEHLPYTLSYYRMHGDNLTSNTTNWQRMKIINGMAIRNRAFGLLAFHWIVYMINTAVIAVAGDDIVSIKKKVIG